MIFFLEIFQVYSIIFYKYPNILTESVLVINIIELRFQLIMIIKNNYKIKYF